MEKDMRDTDEMPVSVKEFLNDSQFKVWVDLRTRVQVGDSTNVFF